MSKVNEFYQELLNLDLDENLKHKFENVQDEKEYRKFIRDEILPLAKSMGYDFSVDEIVAYDESVLQSLSEDELETVAGGGMLKNVSSSVMAALTLMTSGGIANANKDGEQSGESAKRSLGGASSELPSAGTISRAKARLQSSIAANATRTVSRSTTVSRSNVANLRSLFVSPGEVVKSEAAVKVAEQVEKTSDQSDVAARAGDREEKVVVQSEAATKAAEQVEETSDQPKVASKTEVQAEEISKQQVSKVSASPVVKPKNVPQSADDFKAEYLGGAATAAAAAYTSEELAEVKAEWARKDAGNKAKAQVKTATKAEDQGEKVAVQSEAAAKAAEQVEETSDQSDVAARAGDREEKVAGQPETASKVVEQSSKRKRHHKNREASTSPVVKVKDESRNRSVSMTTFSELSEQKDFDLATAAEIEEQAGETVAKPVEQSSKRKRHHKHHHKNREASTSPVVKVEDESRNRSVSMTMLSELSEQKDFDLATAAEIEEQAGETVAKSVEQSSKRKRHHKHHHNHKNREASTSPVAKVEDESRDRSVSMTTFSELSEQKDFDLAARTETAATTSSEEDLILPDGFKLIYNSQQNALDEARNVERSLDEKYLSRTEMQELISKLSASTEKIGLADFEKIISYGRRSIPMSPIMSRSRAPGGSMSPTMSRSRAPGGSMSPATAVMRSTRRETMSPTSTLRGTRRRSMTPVAFPPPAKLELPAGWVLSDRDSLKDQLIRAFNNFIEKTQKSWEQENLNMMKTKLAKMKGDPAVKVLLDDLKDKKITTVDDFDKRFYDLNIVTKTQSRTPGQTDMFIRMVKNLIAEMPKIKKEYSSVEKLVCIHEMLMKLDAFYSSVGDIAKGYLDVEPDKIPKEVKDFLASFQLGKSFREIETYCIGITNELRRLRSHFEMAARNYSRSLDRSSHRAVTFSTVGEIIEECVGKFNQWCREGINVFGEDLQKSISNLDGMSVSKKDMIEFANIFKGIYSSNIIVLKDAVKNYCRIVDGELVSKIKELKQLSREISPTNSQVAPEVQKMEQYVKCWHDLNTQLSSVENTQGALELSVWEDFYKWLLEVIHQDRATSPFSSALDGVQSRLGGFEALAYAQLVMRVPMVLDEALKHSKGYLEELKEYSPKNLSVAVPDDQVKILQDFINEFDDKVLTQKQKSDLIEKCKTSKSIRSLLRAIEELRRYFVVDGLLQDVSTIAMDLSKPTDLSEVGEIQSKVEGFIDKVKRFKTKGERLAQDFQHIQDSGQTKEFLNKVLVWLTLYAKK